MSYKIIYTEESEQDLVNVYRYIAMNLLVPETAKMQIDRIMNTIKGLNELPLRHKIYQYEPWHSKGLRVLPVDSYLVFYIVIEEEKSVAIVRIMYGGDGRSPKLYAQARLYKKQAYHFYVLLQRPYGCFSIGSILCADDSRHRLGFSHAEPVCFN